MNKKIIDNFLDKEYFDKIQSHIESAHFPWNYMDNITRYSGSNKCMDLGMYGFNRYIINPHGKPHDLGSFHHLIHEIDKCLNIIDTPKNIGLPKIYVDRSFSVNGFGTVVTGTLINGSVKVGDDLQIMPQGTKTKIRGIQTHQSSHEEINPGTRVALNLAGIDKNAISRGDLLVKPETNCSTLKMYNAIKFDKTIFSPELDQNEITENDYGNDFESYINSNYKEIKNLLNFLEDLPKVVFTRVTGSGSCIFAAFESKKNAENSLVIFKNQFQKLKQKMMKK